MHETILKKIANSVIVSGIGTMDHLNFVLYTFL